MIFAHDLCTLTSIPRIKNWILLNISAMWAKSPISSCVHVSIIPLFPAVPNFCRLHVCSQKFLSSVKLRKKNSLAKGLKEKIAAVDRGWETFPSLPETLVIKNWGSLEQSFC